MKGKRLRKVLSMLMVIVMLFGMTAQISSSATDKITVKIDGKKLDFDVEPIIKNGRTLVPMRKIFEELGADVTWYQKEKAIVAIKDNEIITMMIGADYFIKGTNNENGVKHSLDVAPEIVNGRTLVPARAVAESLDCTVEWDQASKTVSIKSKRNIENKVLLGRFTNKDSDKVSNTMQGAPRGINVFAGACCGFIYNDTVYYSLVYQPVIYAYDGENTIEYETNGSPSGIVVKDDILYYLNEDDECIESINLKTLDNEILFSRLSSIEEFMIYDKYMYICGESNNSNMAVYILNLKTGDADIIFEAEGREIAVRMSISEDIIPCIILHNTGGQDCYKLNRYDDEWEEISLSEYQSSVNSLPDYYNGYRYYRRFDDGSIVREEESSGAIETIVSGNDSNYYNFMAQNENIVVFWKGKLKSELFHYDENTKTEYHKYYPNTTEGYESADVYVMKTDGSGMKKINSYKAPEETTEGTTSSTENSGTQSSVQKKCSKCNGTRMQICHLCGGSGRGPSYVQAYTHQTIQLSCAPCGGTGKYPCSQCSSLN